MSKLKQDDEPIESYLRKFEQLTLQCEITEKPEQKIARFLEGLNEKIAEKVRMQPLWSFDDVVNLSLKVEKMGKNKGATPKANPKFAQTKTYHGIRIGETPRPIANPASDKGKMSVGQRTNVLQTEDKNKCFQCQGYGHLRKDCPSKRTLTAVEVDAWEKEGLVEYEPEEATMETGDDEEGSSQDMIVAPPDTGHNLVLWRVMQSQPAPLEEDQRSLIFRSRCTILGRVCNLIIDRGSCTNVASTTLVNKLKLSTQDHLNPYKLRWLSKGDEVRVDKQCVVPFSIGSVYKDEVLCDVAPMDACHLLLGRPWEFDKNTVHQGRSNTYTFKHGNRKIILTPLPPNQKNYGSPNVIGDTNGVLFLSEVAMIREMKQEQTTLILLTKEVGESETSKVPEEVESLIRLI
ncbi:hypothetical protein RND81_08G079700 [Saponaria officinalis]|uniref:CCHC-type domain-containing protein n=1 Tax=Saponaria officinalis TaxID=3572 RepID=A0AAW1J5Q6_SAPOF